MIAELMPGPVYGSTCSKGWYGECERGDFAHAQLPAASSNVTLMKGWFDNTFPACLGERREALRLNRRKRSEETR
jgi:hypothetical protein